MLGKIVKSILWYGGLSTFLPFMKVFLLPIYTKYLSPEEYGVITIVLTISSFLTVLFTWGLDGAVSREYFDYVRDGSEVLNRYFIIIMGFLFFSNTGLALLLNGIGTVFSSNIEEYFNVAFHPFVQIAISIAFLSPYLSICLIILRVGQRAKEFSIAQFCRAIISAIITLLLLIVFRIGPLSILIAEIVSCVVTTVYLLRNIMKGLRVNVTWFREIVHYSPRILRNSLVYSLPLLPEALMYWIVAVFDKIILMQYVSLGNIGIYSIGTSMGMGMMIIITAINNAYLPSFLGNASNATYKSVHQKFSNMYVLAVGLACLLLGSFSKEITQHIIPPAYSNATSIMVGLGIAYYWEGIYLMIIPPLYHLKKTKMIPFLAGLSAVINILFNFILIPWIGIDGAAISKIIAYCVMAIVAWIVTERLYSINYSLLHFWAVPACFTLILVGLFRQSFSIKAIIVVPIVILSLVRIFSLWKQCKGCGIASN